MPVIKKIGRLPIAERDKGLHLHCNAHSKWLYGTEVQPPTLHDMSRLRKAVVSCLSKSKNLMRSAFAFSATCHDVFLDPFGAWVLHVFWSLRKELLQDSPVAIKDLEKAREILKASTRKLPATRAGRHNVIAYLCKELDIDICDEDPSRLKRRNDTPLQLKMFSHRFFKEELARSVRQSLFSKIPCRQDFSEPSHDNIDIYRTRLLIDANFSSDDEWSHLRPFFERLPNNMLTGAILRVLLQGSVYTNVRRCAAGMCTSDSCLHCGCRESHKHIFQECPFYESTRPDEEFSQVSWGTGVLFESQQTRETRQRDHARSSLERVPFEPVRAEFAFTDGSCFFDKWAPLRSSAAAVVFPGLTQYAEVTPGSDHSSTRAEIHAVYLALVLSEGNLCIVSDCAYVVNTVRWLQCHRWNKALISKLDNADLWSAVSVAIQGRCDLVSIKKVKAHVRQLAFSQDPWLTKHNEEVDKLAKDEARQLLRLKRAAISNDISTGLDLQIHLVASLSRRLNLLQIPFDEGLSDRSSQKCCTCSPLTRTRTKRSWCLGECRSAWSQGPSLTDKAFLDCVRLSLPVPDSLWQALRHRYPAYWAVYSRLCSWVSGPASVVQDLNWAKHPTKRFCENLLEFWSQSRWHFPNDPKVSDCRVTWQELLYDFVAEFGVVQGFLEPKIRLSLLTRRFRDHSVKVLSAAGVTVVGLSNISHLRCLTGGNAAGICARRQFRFPQVVWGFLISHCLAVSNNSASTKCRPNAHYTPSWDFFPP